MNLRPNKIPACNNTTQFSPVLALHLFLGDRINSMAVRSGSVHSQDPFEIPHVVLFPGR